LTNVLSLNYAASSKEEKIKLYTEAASSKYNSVMINRATRTGHYTEVDSDKLDSFLKSIGVTEVNWIKIDVEGAEYEVLKGAQSIFSKSKDILVLVEVHNVHDENHYQRILEMMLLHNFKVEFEKIYESS